MCGKSQPKAQRTALAGLIEKVGLRGTKQAETTTSGSGLQVTAPNNTSSAGKAGSAVIVSDPTNTERTAPVVTDTNVGTPEQRRKRKGVTGLNV